MTMCRKCGLKPSTGYLIELCDACFDEFEAKTKIGAAISPNGKYQLPDKELEYLHPSQVDRKN